MATATQRLMPSVSPTVPIQPSGIYSHATDDGWSLKLFHSADLVAISAAVPALIGSNLISCVPLGAVRLCLIGQGGSEWGAGVANNFHFFPMRCSQPVVLEPVELLHNVGRIAERTSSKLLRTIRSFYNLEDNWDGDGGAKPARVTINNADYFLQNLDIDELHAPRISLDSDGEISFSWHTERFLLDVGMVGDDTYYYYGESVTDGLKYRDDSRSILHPLPRSIVEMLLK